MNKKEMETRDAQIVELIHENTLRILEEVGIAFFSEGALELLRENGVRVEGNRAYFTPEQVMGALDVATKEFTVHARNPKFDVNMNMDDIYMTPGYGSPSICEADGTLMAKRYGVPCRSGGGMSDANGLTAQAGVESAMSMFESFSERANLMMHATGSLHSFNSVSFEKFIMDIETFTRMKYYFDELPVDEDALAFDAIKEAIEGDGTFVTSDHTYERCRIDPWYSQVSIHGKADGNPNEALYRAIQKRIHTLLDGYQCPSLPSEKRSKLDALMRGIGMEEKDIARV